MKANLNDLRAFIMVARTNSFTKAANQMGVSQSALSHSIRGIEERLAIRLFHRTTRSLSLTEAGEQLFQRLSPLFDDIDNQIAQIHDFRQNNKGSLRLSGSEHAFNFVLWQALSEFARHYPDIQLELVADTRPVDIVAERFDAGIRIGAETQHGMNSVQISPDMKMCVVASPDYLAKHGTPQSPNDLTQHSCIALRVLASGGLLNWEFCQPQSPHHVLKIQPHGQLIASQTPLLRKAALSGMGLAWLPRDTVAEDIRAGSLKTVLDDWAISYAPYHLYYPQHREQSGVLPLLVAFLKNQMAQ